MSFFSIVVAFLVLLVVGLLWFIVYYFNNPVIENPDGIARVEGNCGDTMEIGLKIEDGKVVASHFWTNGCSFSKQCVETAAMLVKGRELGEAKRINMVSIMDQVGQLPDTHLHCAQLAEITLQRSIDDYLQKQKGKIVESDSDTLS